MTTPRTFRSREQWQSIIDDFSTSDLSAPKFCKQNDLPYGSFAKWRQKLLSPSTTSNPESPTASFFDLGSLAGADPKSAWHITLKLGNGVELVLSQA